MPEIVKEAQRGEWLELEKWHMDLQNHLNLLDLYLEDLYKVSLEVIENMQILKNIEH